MPLTWNAILLGTGSDNDTNEGSLTTEANFAGASVGSAANPLSDRIYTFTVNDTDNDDIWDRNNVGQGNETASVTFNGTTQTVNLDSVIVYNATITYADGAGTANITAVTFQLTDGRVFLAPELTANADNAALNFAPIQSITLNSVNTNNTNLTADRMVGDFVPCFTRGTMILTPEGERRIEDLRIGDLVVTADQGPQPLRWIGRRMVAAIGDLAPVEIDGPDGRCLRVSPQHRVLVSDWRAEMYFAESEVLVPAKSLVDNRHTRIVEGGFVEYFHLLFDRHQIVFAEGMPAESLHLGEYGLSALDPAARSEIEAIFPELGQFGPHARPTVRTHAARVLC